MRPVDYPLLTTDCHMLWIGDRLGAVERACIRSVLRQGHSLSLWTYDTVDGVPESVVVRDAREILPESAIIRHRSGSVSLFSNRFRFELLRRGYGIWLDTDQYLLQPLDTGANYLMGEEAPGVIATGVLRLPRDCPVIDKITRLFDEQIIPFWLGPRARLEAWLRLKLSGRTGIDRMPWGSLGPRAMTAYSRQHGLAGLALPQSVFYPFPWQQAHWILDPHTRVDDGVDHRTVGVHLWNECIKAFKDAPAPAGSFLARLQQEGK